MEILYWFIKGFVFVAGCATMFVFCSWIIEAKDKIDSFQTRENRWIEMERDLAALKNDVKQMREARKKKLKALAELNRDGSNKS